MSEPRLRTTEEQLPDPKITRRVVERYTCSPATLLPAHSELWDWQLRARCRGADSTMFYPPENTRGPVRMRLEFLAKDVCWQCPVLQECREHALRTREPYGIWGGMTAKERALADHYAVS